MHYNLVCIFFLLFHRHKPFAFIRIFFYDDLNVKGVAIRQRALWFLFLFYVTVSCVNKFSHQKRKK